MGRVAALGLVLAVAILGGAQAAAAATGKIVAAEGVEVQVRVDWSRVAPAASGTSRDHRTVLVAGTRGVTARASRCQVAAYRVPADGAAIVVLARRDTGSEGLPDGRGELAAMRLREQLFSCWDGRGAVGQVVLGGRIYQVNVLVGDRASRATIASALAGARSLDLAGR